MTHSNKITALIVADYLILKSQQDNRPVTNKKLQKLLYYVQAWSMAIRNKEVFNDKIEAWIHGPAIRAVYLEFKQFGATPILKKIDSKQMEVIDADTKKIIDDVWNVYSSFDTPYLEHLTHSEDPWQNARRGLESDMSSDKEITVESMKIYYEKKLVASTNTK